MRTQQIIETNFMVFISVIGEQERAGLITGSQFQQVHSRLWETGIKENVDDSTDIQRFRPIQKERWKTRKKNIEKIIAQSCVQVCCMRTRRSSYTNFFLQDFSLKKAFSGERSNN